MGILQVSEEIIARRSKCPVRVGAGLKRARLQHHPVQVSISSLEEPAKIDLVKYTIAEHLNEVLLP